MKTCSKCREIKPFSDYGKNRAKKDGLQSRCKDCRKEYSANNRDKIAEYNKEYRANNSNKIKEYRGKPEVKERSREWQREQTKNNPQIRLSKKVSNETRWILLGVFSGMTPVSEQYGIDKVGLTSIQYREYIESLWTEGMSWDNYGHGEGKWTIDHMRPKNFYDLTDPELYRKCSYYTNTQPMWFVDNVVKGDRLLD